MSCDGFGRPPHAERPPNESVDTPRDPPARPTLIVWDVHLGAASAVTERAFQLRFAVCIAELADVLDLDPDPLQQ